MTPQVALVFPPLVDTNFGRYYPSTAVLAAYLCSKGVSVIQEDLNELFASYLLRDDILAEFEKGRFGLGTSIRPESMASESAQLLRRHREELFDEAGRHLFHPEGSGLGYLLHDLADPLRVDLAIEELVSLGAERWPAAEIYEAFFASTGYREGLPQSITLLGISIPMGPQIAPSLLLARHMKKRRPDIAIVVGGPAMSLLSDDDRLLMLEQFPDIDAIIRFDGELPLAALVEQRLAGCWQPEQVPSVSCRVGGKVVEVPPGPGLRLADLPHADYDSRLLSRLLNPELGITQARGCYWGNCSYCDFVELYEGSPSYRTLTAPQFVETMKYQIARHGISRFSVITEAMPPGFARRLCDEIERHSLEVTWNSFAMVDQVYTPELLRRMVKAGCESLVIGMETLNNRVLKLVRKACTGEGNMRFLKYAQAAGMDLKINLIPDLPSTTATEAFEVLDLMKDFRGCFSSVAIFPFEATRSSEIGRNPERFELVRGNPEAPSGQSLYASNHLHSTDPAMTSEERLKIHAAYRAFARDVNGGWGEAGTFATSEWIATDRLVCLTKIETNLRSSRDGDLLVFHWATREFFKLPEGWDSVLSLLSSMGTFRPSEFARRFEPAEVGERLLETLSDHRLLKTIRVGHLAATSS